MKKEMLSRRHILFSILFISWGCGTTQTAVEKEMLASEVREAVAEGSFRFEATHVYPTGFRSLYLSPHYDVTVTADTVKAHLPYYGRAYHAPLDPREGGFQFSSTDFTYRYAAGRRSGSWEARITILDQDRPITLIFDIWENGSSHLVVNDFNRQSISFQGDSRGLDAQK